jgi:hypothetical protein
MQHDLFTRIQNTYIGLSAFAARANKEPQGGRWLRLKRVQIERQVQATRLLDLYRSLSVEEGEDVIHSALDVLLRTSAERSRIERIEHSQAEEILVRVASIVPGAMNDLHEVLLTFPCTWDWSLFHVADAAFAQCCIEKIAENADFGNKMQLNNLLGIMAWIGNSTVQKQFARWREVSPSWRSHLYIAPEAYTREAGWELDEHGRRRDLFMQECYELLPLSLASTATFPGPVSVGGPLAKPCLYCGGPRIMLFDIDLRDPRLNFLGVRGERLQIDMCIECTSMGYPLVTDIYQRRFVYADSQVFAAREYTGQQFLPPRQFVLGAARRTPYETHMMSISAMGFVISQLGGHPEWIDDAAYPTCPACRRTMLFIGQVTPGDIEPAEGMIYAFLCRGCGKATTIYQQT